jgi:hypothetical protein
MAKPEKKPNPFSHNRVDTPFQIHTDFKEVYKDEFNRLQSIIEDIERDKKNHQSRGVVVIGEPGMGKTHLMMRLATERLQNNRLLFIRQPNNINFVLYHIYSRMLESFVEKVPNSDYSQLEHLLANSFSKIICDTFESQTKKSSTGILASINNLANKDKSILEVISKGPLNIYHELGREGTRAKREYWQRIENMVNAWWKKHHSEGGYSMTFIQGIIKFCSYSDQNKKNLVSKWLSANELEPDELESIGLKHWQEDISKEEFSQQAISVFGRLSVMDKPLIIIFDQLEALGEAYNEKLLRRFGEAVKEIFTHVPNSLIVLNLFPQRWEHFQTVFDGAVIDRVSQEQIWLNFPDKDKLKEILVLNAQQQGIKLDELFTPADLEDILNQNSIRNVLVRASDTYKYKVDGIPLPNRSTTKLVKVKTTKAEPSLTEQLKLLDEKITAKDFEKNLSEQLKNLEAKILAKGVEEDIAEQLKSLEEKLAARSFEQTLTEQLKTLEQNLAAQGVENGITEQLKSIEEKLTTRRFEEILIEEIKAIKQEIMNLKTLMEELMMTQKSSRPSVEEEVENYSNVRETIEENTAEEKEKTIGEVEEGDAVEEKNAGEEVEAQSEVKPDNLEIPTTSLIEDYLNEHQFALSQEYDHNSSTFINDSDDLGKLITILNVFQTVKEGISFFHPELDDQEWQDYLIVDTPSKSVIIGFLHAEGKTFNNKLQISQRLLAEYFQDINHFGLFRDQRQRSLEEKENQVLQEFRSSQKGFVSIMDKDKRVTFELAYQLVTDILNKEEKFELPEALNTLESHLGEQNWLIRLLK